MTPLLTYVLTYEPSVSAILAFFFWLNYFINAPNNDASFEKNKKVVEL